MKSYIIARYYVGDEPQKNIDLDKYRYFIGYYSQFKWKEDVNSRYAKIQKERREGTRGDNMEAREKMDFYFQYTKDGEFEFAGSYDRTLEVINISFEKSPLKDTLNLLYVFAKYLEADLYEGNTKVTPNNIYKDIGYSDLLNEGIKANILNLQSLFNRLLAAYPSRVLNFKNLERRFLIMSWDYSIDSLVNLRNIVLWDVLEGIPHKESRLYSSLGMEYLKAFEFYLGEVIIKSESNYSWSSIKINDEDNMILMHMSKGSVLIPGATILKLIASTGEYDIVHDIRFILFEGSV